MKRTFNYMKRTFSYMKRTFNYMKRTFNYMKTHSVFNYIYINYLIGNVFYIRKNIIDKIKKYGKINKTL